jgi:uncharacterized membrane protein YphA (DoxX/SURF4 family)
VAALDVLVPVCLLSGYFFMEYMHIGSEKNLLIYVGLLYLIFLDPNFLLIITL